MKQALQPISISKERFQELKALVQRHKEAAREWAEALREIRASGRWKEESSSWELWCLENAGATAASLRMQDMRERRRISDQIAPKPEESPEKNRNSYPVPLIQPSTQVINMPAKLDQEAAPVAFVNPPQTPIIPALPVVTSTDASNLVGQILKGLGKLAKDGRVPYDLTFEVRYLIAQAERVQILLQPDLPGLAEQVPTAQKGRGTLVQVQGFFADKSLSLTAADAEWFFYKCEGCGWKNGGKAIVDWRATVRAWKAQSIFPSQKSTTTPSYGRSNNNQAHQSGGSGGDRNAGTYNEGKSHLYANAAVRGHS